MLYSPNPDSQHILDKHNYCDRCKREKIDAAEGNVGVKVLKSIVFGNLKNFR